MRRTIIVILGVLALLVLMFTPWMFIPNSATDTPDCAEKEVFITHLENLDTLARFVQAAYPDYDSDKVSTEEEVLGDDVQSAFNVLHADIYQVITKVRLPNNASTKMYKRKRGIRRAGKRILKLAEAFVEVVETHDNLDSISKKEVKADLNELKEAITTFRKKLRNHKKLFAQP